MKYWFRPKTADVRLGDFANVRITGAEAFDLYGEVVGPDK
jgi:tRNA A37 methylthiotransferase MiaB